MSMIKWAAALSLVSGLALGFPGCKGGDDRGGSGGDSAGGSSANGGTGGGGSGGSGPKVTFMADVLPIFSVKCAPCHQTGGTASLFHTMASNYTSAIKASSYCKLEMKKKGECTIVRIQNGEMPQGAGCTGNAATDASNDKCLTQAEQDTVQAWIDGGLVEK